MAGEDLKQKVRDGKAIKSAGVRITANPTGSGEGGRKRSGRFLTSIASTEPYSEIHLMELCLAAKDLDVPVGIRIKHNRLSFMIGVMLDLGPLMITVPQVEDDENGRRGVERLLLLSRRKAGMGRHSADTLRPQGTRGTGCLRGVLEHARRTVVSARVRKRHHQRTASGQTRCRCPHLRPERSETGPEAIPPPPLPDSGRMHRARKRTDGRK